jgi:hypothetical protein
MNKRLVSELVKVANSLDVMGFNKEANSLDRIARKILSEDTTKTTDPTPTGVYKDDINTYKNLLQQKKYKEAEYFLKQVANSYQDQQQRDAFVSQAAKIDDQYLNQKINEDNMSDDEIYNLLQKYGINDAADLADLNKKWNVMMTNLKNENLLSKNKKRLLRFTYRNIAAKFNYSAFGLEVTGNYKKDLGQYTRLYTNRLTNDAETFLNNVMSSDKYNNYQKQVFAKEAEYQKNFYNPEILDNDGNYYILTDESINENLNNYGVLKAKNYQEFNNAFYNMIKDEYMNKKFTNEINNPKAPMLYGYPGVRKQLQLVKENIMLRRGWKKPV